jgi:hypothetical protein
MVLLLVGALITSILVPTFQRQSERRQREHDLKDQLALRINDAVSPFLAATLSNGFARSPGGSHAYDSAYERWTTDSSAILTEMTTYFPGDPVGDDWRRLQFGVQWLYYLFKAKPPHAEAERASILKRFIRPYVRRYEGCQHVVGIPCNDISYEALEKLDFRNDPVGGVTHSALERLLNTYRLSAESIIDEVLSKTPRT